MFLYYDKYEKKLIQETLNDITMSKIHYYDKRKEEKFYNMQLSLYEAVKYYIHQYKCSYIKKYIHLDEIMNKYLYSCEIIPKDMFEYINNYIQTVKETLHEIDTDNDKYTLAEIDQEMYNTLCIEDNLYELVIQLNKVNILNTTTFDLISYTDTAKKYYGDFLNSYDKHDEMLMKEFDNIIENLNYYYGNYHSEEQAQKLLDTKDEDGFMFFIDEYISEVKTAMYENCDQNSLFMPIKCDKYINEYDYIFKSSLVMSNCSYSDEYKEFFINIQEENFGYNFVHILLYYFILKAYLEEGSVGFGKKNANRIRYGN